MPSRSRRARKLPSGKENRPLRRLEKYLLWLCAALWLAALSGPARALTGSDAKNLRRLEVTQRIHVSLKIILGNARQLLPEFITKRLSLRCLIETCSIEQLVQPRRPASELFSDPWTAAAKRH